MRKADASAATMKAWVCGPYGPPETLQLVDVPMPSPPGAGEVLVRIHAASVSSGDARVRALRMPPGLGFVGRLALGFRRPRRAILGTEFSGTVAAVGNEVAGFSPGDAVFGFPGAQVGCHAEYRIMPANGRIARKPEGLSFAEAAALCFGGSTAMHFLRKADLKPGERVLVIGASGAVGSALARLAVLGGARVTGIASGRNADFVRSLGVEGYADYTEGDLFAGSRDWDIIADAVGATTFADARGALAEGGRFLAIAGGVTDMFSRKSGGRRLVGGPAEERVEDIPALAELAASGDFRPHVERVYEFTQMREAHAHVDTGRKRGAVVVAIVPEGDETGPG
ncbi:MAG: NAD(P)-dependent alcohol dehydrogenase [Salinarimonadaceae bacterium]|nr:MAG: NAD(P)-dependent alcohol dehydrogenase [Salinarimonadaceae bacterium]